MTSLTNSIIASQSVAGAGDLFEARAARTGEPLGPDFRFSSAAQVAEATQAAADAFDAYRETTGGERASFLDRAAAEIEADGQQIIERAHLESGLPEARLTGELARTTGQLRLFAQVLREGSWTGARIDPAQPERVPQPRADIRQRKVPVGPVAVFGASNFPLAFSTAGGDTASALAAGSPVIVKAHNAHPGTAALVGHAIARAVHAAGLPGGVFSQVFGSGREIGQQLVADPRIAAVGFTGSRSGGLALVATAQARPVPIPVYAEMSSINPVVILKHALSTDPAALARDYVASLTLGSGQFCTNPGVLFVPAGSAADQFRATVQELIDDSLGQTMLTSGIRAAFESGVEQRRALGDAQVIAEGHAQTDANAPAPIIFAADASSGLSDSLTDEIFGAAGLIISYSSADELRGALEHLEGQLTATVFADEADHAVARALLPTLERKVGRVLFNGWPTGVEVGHAIVHGGPFPATSDSRTTSVGTLAIERFLRPVAYQDVPAALLPDAIRDENPQSVPQRIDGVLRLPSGYSH